MGAAPSLTRIVFCDDCGMRFFDRGLSDDEAGRYYRGYRDEEYLAARNRYEPFYTARVNRELIRSAGSPRRRHALAAVLARSGGARGLGSVLDFGGGDGGLIADLDSPERVVVDPSDVPPAPGVRRSSEAACVERRWDLVVCAQVLEHLTDPRQTVDRLGRLLTPGGRLYLEVPDEIWAHRTFAGRSRDRLLDWLITRPALFTAGDVLSTACRIKLGALPPFGFIPMREHLQYFTESSLCAMVRACGLRVALSGRNDAGQLYAVAVGPARDAA